MTQEHEFDRFTRRFARQTGRRNVLKLFALGAASSLLPGISCSGDSPTELDLVDGQPDFDCSLPDPITEVSLSAARDTLGAQTDNQELSVPLSPHGCSSITRRFSGGVVVFEVVTIDGLPVSVCTGTRDRLTCEYPDSDVRLRVEISRAGEGRLVRTSFPYGFRHVETYERRGSLLHVKFEVEDLDTGQLVTEAEFDAPLYEAPGGTASAGVAASASASASAAAPKRSFSTVGCTQAQASVLKELYDSAATLGEKCLRDKGKKELAGAVAKTGAAPIRIRCYSDPSDNTTTVIDWLNAALGKKGGFEIKLNTASFFDDPNHADPAQRMNILFHEILHVDLPKHNPNIASDEGGTPRFAEVDRVYACAALCFEPPTNEKHMRTRCACARCLQTNKCDDRCKDLPDCSGDMGGICPRGGTYFPTKAACDENCPAGSKCSTTGYDVECPKSPA